MHTCCTMSLYLYWFNVMLCNNAVGNCLIAVNAYSCRIRIQYNTIKSICSALKVENRIWGADRISSLQHACLTAVNAYSCRIRIQYNTIKSICSALKAENRILGADRISSLQHSKTMEIRFLSVVLKPSVICLGEITVCSWIDFLWWLHLCFTFCRKFEQC